MAAFYLAISRSTILIATCRLHVVQQASQNEQQQSCIFPKPSLHTKRGSNDHNQIGDNQAARYAREMLAVSSIVVK
ncbi:hypothetical protein VIAG107301_19675 [Vibrio agarivorans]